MDEEKKDVYNGEYIAKEVSTFLNNMSSRRSETGEKLFIQTFSREHRTIQQKLTSLCIDWLKHLAGQQHWDPQE
ncbi:hypothetical protein C4588_01855 [Candidatus Parcubacteria bacterium]|nr:MAG: hypothetical protein C4588_01855 [Candidatus Parcubacteria bacterium]